MDPITVLGTVGAVIILVFFLLNQFKVLSVDSLTYDVGNLVGSIILLAYAYLIFSVPFMLINAVWLLASLRDVYADVRRKK